MIRQSKRVPRAARVTAAYTTALGSRLTDRDRTIIRDCYEHRVLTSEQIRRLHFGDMRTAQVRLDKLYGMRLLDRFRPPWSHGEGSTPYHWVLDEAGAHVIAEQRGLERSELRWRHDAAIGLAKTATLRHQVDVNEFFTRLTEEARAAGGALREWWGERDCREALDEIVVPDGYGLIQLPGTTPASFLLELDRATEDHERLRQKARRYAKALPRSELSDNDPIVVLAVPTAGRRAALERALAGTGVPIAAVVWTAQHSALEALQEALLQSPRAPTAARSADSTEPTSPTPPPAPYV